MNKVTKWQSGVPIRYGVLIRCGFLPGVLGPLAACDADYPPTTWEDPSYDHAAFSGGFQLLGAHVDAPCTGCHAPTDFTLLFQPSDGSDCVACHRAQYEAQHGTRGYPTSCVTCHTPTVWTDASFDHQEVSGGFDLLGSHADLGCLACHAAQTFEPLFDGAEPSDCAVCHTPDFPSGHEQRGFPTACGFCHTPTRWSDGLFDHQVASGGFELLGIHNSLPCVFCHVPETFQPRFDPESATDCVTCHQSRYDLAHQGTGFPTTCVACHTPTSWGDGKFDHVSISGGFDLVGVHAEKPCVSCHDPESFEPFFDPDGAGDCVSCHQADYDGQHGGQGFPTVCTECHTPTRWTDVSFSHEVASGGFRLLGIHGAVTCESCHDEATFEPLFDPAGDGDCLSCHQADYDGEHAGSGYPTTCLSCHTPTTWTATSFDHDTDFFPIFTGDHAPRWSDCATCHTDSDDFTLFTCFNCHAHNQAAMDKKHEERAGYSYVSSACLSCHPDGTS